MGDDFIGLHDDVEHFGIDVLYRTPDSIVVIMRGQIIIRPGIIHHLPHSCQQFNIGGRQFLAVNTGMPHRGITPRQSIAISFVMGKHVIFFPLIFGLHVQPVVARSKQYAEESHAYEYESMSHNNSILSVFKTRI